MTSEYFCVGITVVIVNPDSYGAVGKILEINDLGIVFEITRSGSWGGFIIREKWSSFHIQSI